jgi:hypothetical protein
VPGPGWPRGPPEPGRVPGPGRLAAPPRGPPERPGRERATGLAGLAQEPQAAGAAARRPNRPSRGRAPAPPGNPTPARGPAGALDSNVSVRMLSGAPMRLARTNTVRQPPNHHPHQTPDGPHRLRQIRKTPNHHFAANSEPFDPTEPTQRFVRVSLAWRRTDSLPARRRITTLKSRPSERLRTPSSRRGETGLPR